VTGSSKIKTVQLSIEPVENGWTVLFLIFKRGPELHHNMLGLLRALFAIALGTLAMSCAEASISDQFHVTIDGQIDASLVERTANEIVTKPAGTVLLTVTSTGGDSLQAMKLGDIIRDYEVAMRVRHYCHSACSQYLMPSATRVTVEGKASIAFHGTPSWITPGDNSSIEVREYFESYKIREREFLEQRGIDYRSWQWTQYHKLPACWFENSQASISSPERFGSAARVNLVVPSRTVLSQLGVNGLQGEMPHSAKEAWEYATAVGFQKSITLVFVNEIAVPEGWSQPSLTRCSKEITSSLGY